MRSASSRTGSRSSTESPARARPGKFIGPDCRTLPVAMTSPRPHELMLGRGPLRLFGRSESGPGRANRQSIGGVSDTDSRGTDDATIWCKRSRVRPGCHRPLLNRLDLFGRLYRLLRDGRIAGYARRLPCPACRGGRHPVVPPVAPGDICAVPPVALGAAAVPPVPAEPPPASAVGVRASRVTIDRANVDLDMAVSLPLTNPDP